MTQHGQATEQLAQTPIYASGPPGDWDALLGRSALWVLAVVGFCLGGAAFLSTSRSGDTAKSLVEKSSETSVLAAQNSDIADRVAAISDRLAQNERKVAQQDELADRQGKLEQSLGGLEKKVDDTAAKTTQASARIDKLDADFSQMDLRLTKSEDAEVALQTTLAKPAASGLIPAPSPDRDGTAFTLTRYEIVSIGKHTVRLSGPDGMLVRSKGDKLPDGAKILKISKRGAKPRVVTDHGVIAAKAAE